MIAKILLVLLALSLGKVEPVERVYAVPASVDISAIRYIGCDGYTGSGFLIADHILVTADHIARGSHCVDLDSGAALTAYVHDPEHDTALMTSKDLPVNIPYIKYSCSGLKPNKAYISYGITDYNTQVPIVRNNTIISTNEIIQEDDAVYDFPHSKGMRVFDGPIAPGMSGGPVTDVYGYTYAINNAGSAKQTLLFDITDSILCSDAAAKYLKQPV